MKVVLITTAGDPLGGALGASYQRCGGPPISHVVLLPGRRDLDWSPWGRAFVACKLLGWRGITRFARLNWLKGLASARDKAHGLDRTWPRAICFPSTEVIRLADIHGTEGMHLLRRIAPDLIVSVGAPTLLRQSILALPHLGAINLHNGSIPEYRGHFATFWEILHREAWSSVCVHGMTGLADCGTVLAQERLAPLAFDSFLDLLIAKKITGGRLLAQVVDRFARGTLSALPHGLCCESSPGSYHGWPTLEDIRRFSWKRRARAA
jgi:folate-dependent phosphoribosylglycinamide formyltransferase PurN